MFESYVEENGEIINDGWIEWTHFLIPNKPQNSRAAVRELLYMLGHCKNCTALSGCYMADRNKTQHPLHCNCDCKIKAVDKREVRFKARAVCPIEKFTEYVFSGKGAGKHKGEIFSSWGFTKEDSLYLKHEIERQALIGYLSGNYLLKKLDVYGQRISILTEIKGHLFYSGWILEPEGKIRSTTPLEVGHNETGLFRSADAGDGGVPGKKH